MGLIKVAKIIRSKIFEIYFLDDWCDTFPMPLCWFEFSVSEKDNKFTVNVWFQESTEFHKITFNKAQKHRCWFFEGFIFLIIKKYWMELEVFVEI